MEKVYLVYLDNGGMYDDWFTEVKKVFRNKVSAIAYIHSEGYTEEEDCSTEQWYDYRYYRPNHCSMDYFMYIEEHILK